MVPGGFPWSWRVRVMLGGPRGRGRSEAARHGADARGVYRPQRIGPTVLLLARDTGATGRRSTRRGAEAGTARPIERDSAIAERHERRVPDHDMVEQVDVEQAPGGERLRRQVQVVRAGGRIATGMVVDEDDARRVRADSVPEELAHADEGGGDVALGQRASCPTPEVMPILKLRGPLPAPPRHGLGKRITVPKGPPLHGGRNVREDRVVSRCSKTGSFWSW